MATACGELSLLWPQMVAFQPSLSCFTRSSGMTRCTHVHSTFMACVFLALAAPSLMALPSFEGLSLLSAPRVHLLSTLVILLPACRSPLTYACVRSGGDSRDDRATGASIPACMWAAPHTLWDNYWAVQDGQRADRPHGTTQQGKQNGSRVRSSADLFSGVPWPLVCAC